MTGLHELAATLPGMLLLLGYTAPVLFGFFCAWWAQEHDRNPWLWFFFGALLSPIAHGGVLTEIVATNALLAWRAGEQS